MQKGTGVINVTLNGRVLVVGSHPFMVVGLCLDDDTGELVNHWLYGPPDTSFRRFEFVARHENIKVNCSAKCEWQFVDRYSERDSDPVDSVPVEVPLRMRQGLTVEQQIRQELVAADHRRYEASGRSDGFIPDDDEDAGELTDYEVTELLIDEAMEVADGKDNPEVRPKGESPDGDGNGETGSRKDPDLSKGNEPGKNGGSGSGEGKASAD